ncbi:MAG: hypothetical protein OXC46_11475 [Thaumarchaeota archaeon]|nr:hypothetical protein [Nitrososphaerota archaeon]
MEYFADPENLKMPDNDSLDAKLLYNQILVQKLTKQRIIITN